ncbi:hypothetical protein SteCoe_8372 [Stentor coeruleus]|uniref:GRIP domain-containing protein n=1 Tax=Stentor coeruleus TaxID=5963 RepID=A0A1R2CKG0_9CILI|nr:hypothetical protein SteCoe_8372 [Stentor coeruleus]
MVNRQEILDYFAEHGGEVLEDLQLIAKNPQYLNDKQDFRITLSEKLLKASISISLEYFVSVFSTVANPVFAKIQQSFITALISYLFKSHSPIQIVKVLGEASLPNVEFGDEFCYTSLNETILAENQELKNENSLLKAKIEEITDKSPDLERDPAEKSKKPYSFHYSRGWSIRNIRNTSENHTKPSENSGFYEFSTEIKNCDRGDTVKILEFLLFCERIKCQKFISLAKISQNAIESIEQEILSDLDLEKEAFLDQNPLSLRVFLTAFADFQKIVVQKLEFLTEKLRQSQILISDIKYEYQSKLSEEIETLKSELDLTNKYLKKTLLEKEKFQDFCNELQQEKKNLEIRFVRNTLNLENQVKDKTKDAYKLQEKIHRLENEISVITILKDKLLQEREHGLDSTIVGIEDQENPLLIEREMLVFENLTLKSEIITLERNLSKSLGYEQRNKELEEYVKNQEIIIKDLKDKINESSEDSLSLNASNEKNIIEVKELREALMSISQRYEQDKQILLKDCEEARQDMEAQMFRLKQEKAYAESVSENYQKHLVEVCKEKETLEKEIYMLSQFYERFKDSKSPKSIMRSENELASSVEFDLTKSIEVFERCNTSPQKTIQDTILDELQEISIELRNKHSEDFNMVNLFGFIKATLLHMMKLQDLIKTETSLSPNYREINQNLSDVFAKLKMRVKNLQDESIILNRKLDNTEQHILYTEPAYSLTERDKGDLLHYYKTQLQIEKSKVLEKKHTIKLHNEQISFLKQSLRELQIEISKARSVDFEYFKDVFKTLIREIPIQEPNVESMVELLFKILNFSQNEKTGVTETRRSKRQKHGFRSIFS